MLHLPSTLLAELTLVDDVLPRLERRGKATGARMVASRRERRKAA
jgi:hypothetical protein